MNTDITKEQVDTYIDHIRQSDALGKSERRLRLLEHLILAELAGDGQRLKAYSIGLDIFDKTEDFDPTTDSIVRVEIGRLRTALELFEASSFATTDITVEIPVGTYQPKLSIRKVQTEAVPKAAKSRADRVQISAIAAIAVALMCLASFSIYSHWPQDPPLPISQPSRLITVQVKQFQGDPVLASHVGTALRQSLARSQGLSVLIERSYENEGIYTDYYVRGVAFKSNDPNTKTSVELVSSERNEIVWAKSTQLRPEFDLEEQVKQILGSELRARIFGAATQSLADLDPKDLAPEQLVVMASWPPGSAVNALSWELERVTLMDIALQKDPNFGPAHSILADKLAYLANVSGPSNTSELLEKSVFHAQRAMELSPLDPNVVFNVAQSQWHAGKIKASEAYMGRVLELDSDHNLARFMQMVIPFTCTRADDHTLNKVIALDKALSPDNPIRWLTLSWISWLHADREEYEQALENAEKSAQIFQTPYAFMLHALLHRKLGNPEASVDLIESHRVNWPDIAPSHFAEVTIPRLCSESADSGKYIDEYKALADILPDHK